MINPQELLKNVFKKAQNEDVENKKEHELNDNDRMKLINKRRGNDKKEKWCRDIIVSLQVTAAVWLKKREKWCEALFFVSLCR
jgi:hypothetical protein